MKLYLKVICFLLFIITGFQCTNPTPAVPKESEKTKDPNIVVIIVDDLGYADLGCYGSEIQTKNIDKLASEGIQFTRFYASPNCSPTRAMLMTGNDNHLVGKGAMVLALGENQKGVPGYEGYLNNQCVTFSELLKDKGYSNYYTGKWHLGINEISNPNARGFDQAWYQKGGAPKSHFNLSLNNPKRPDYFENGVIQKESKKDFFSTNFFTDKLLEYISNKEDSNSPFLAMLSFSAVHLPIHCPEEYIDVYAGKYKKGYEKIRNERLSKQKSLGIIAKDTKVAKLPHNVIPWEELDPDEKTSQARKMEIYAGMLHQVDDNVGKLVGYLKDIDQYDNTLIILMSDNGGAGFNGFQSKRGQAQYAKANNTLENLGREGSHYFIGAGWGAATSSPFRLFKRHITEGGLRIPVIIAGGYLEGKAEGGIMNHEIFTVRDIAPTLQKIAGINYPEEKYKNRTILPQTGKSFASLLENSSAKSIHDKEEIFGWEIFKRKAVQKNDWKIVWIEPEFGKNQWELFNLNEDPTEQNDLADAHPEKLKEMIDAWDIYRKDNNVIVSNDPLKLP